MTDRVTVGNLRVAQVLYDFVNNEALPGTDIDPDTFWAGVDKVVADLTPKNQDLLARRDDLQAQIDKWHRQRVIEPIDPEAYKQFLTEIGYLQPEPADFTITTAGVDDEITTTAGPQLVVPILNARFALNAANARWGSLYDALYGTDVIPEDDGAEKAQPATTRCAATRSSPTPASSSTRPCRWRRARGADATGLKIEDGQLLITLGDDCPPAWRRPSSSSATPASSARPSWSVLLRNHGLHIEILIDPESPVGSTDAAGIKDVVLESAITTIMDFEDSVAAVDADDKVLGYRNWLGLNKGDLAEEVTKDGKTFTRVLNQDRTYTTPDGGELTLPGRSLLFVRNVGHLMTNDAIVDADGKRGARGHPGRVVHQPDRHARPEGRATATGRWSTAAPARSTSSSRRCTAPTRWRSPSSCSAGSRTCSGCRRTRIKVGIMDEERRTTVNLKACIKAAADRVVFINTGFLDRTGDEIHTSMEAGPMIRKGAMKSTHVDQGLRGPERRHRPGHRLLRAGADRQGHVGDDRADGRHGRAEDRPAEGRRHHRVGAVADGGHPARHALPRGRRVRGAQGARGQDAAPTIDELLTIPLAKELAWAPEEIREEVDNNCQSILGYVVRWIDAGVGCSKVPDIHNVALMEDRATLRISSQLLANWLRHGVITEDDVKASLRRMAAVVDKQNEKDPEFRPMAPDPDASIAFQAAQELILSGGAQPNGYTEPILHRRRREYKAASNGG